MKPESTCQDGERKFARLKPLTLEENGRFSGYASLFGQEDLSGDIIVSGAFKKSISRRGIDTIRMLFQHDPNAPIGVWTMIREDAKGLYVEGMLMLDVEQAKDIHALMKQGALDGLSIGFKTICADKTGKGSKRIIREVDLWEISIVTFPMLPTARVETVKSDKLPTTRDFERWLTQDAGLTRKQARTIIHSGFKTLTQQREAVGQGGTETIVQAISRATQAMTQ